MNIPVHIRKILPKIPFARRFIKSIGHNTVLLHFGRAGSTVLCNQFKQHPEIEWQEEIFEPSKQKRENLTQLYIKGEPFRTIGNFIQSKKKAFFGFEIKVFSGQHLDNEFNSINESSLVDNLTREGINSFVVLKRNNYLRQYVSAHVGWQRRKWHVSVDEKVELTKINLPIAPATMASYEAPLVEFFRRKNQVYSNLQSSLQGKDVLWINFEEDIETDPTEAYNKCVKFWGLNECRSKVDLKRANNNSLKDVLANYDEVVTALSGTEFEWMLRE